ncbi:MAG: RNA polymerase sigma factor [Chloroflexota bacterium]
MEDQTLICALLADRYEGFEHLARAYQHRLYALSLRATGRAEHAQDVVQDTLLRAYRALSVYDDERIRTLAPRPWLFQIAMNVIRNRARGARPTLSLDESRAEGLDPADDAPDPAARAVTTDTSRTLATLVSTLPRPQRESILLRYVADLPYQDAAAALGLPVGTVKSHVHRGLRTLRARLAEQSEMGVTA